MEITTLFAVSGAGVFSMLGIRMLEIKYERCIGLAHVSLRVDRLVKPHAKKYAKVLDEKRSLLVSRIEAIPQRIKRWIGVYAQHALASWESHYEFLAHSFRGKRMLSGGSVSFYLLNISDPARSKHAEATHPEENAESATSAPEEPVVVSLSDLETDEDSEEKKNTGLTGDPEETVKEAMLR